MGVKSILSDFSKLKARVLINAPLAPYLAYKVGGPADVLVLPKSEDELCEAVDLVAKKKLPLFVLGSGTNLLVRDGGVRGVVIYLGPKIATHPKILSEQNGKTLIEVSSWCSKARFLEWSLDQGFEGLEFSAGIPGTMGGALWMNAGTKWGSYEKVIHSAIFYSQAKGRVEKSLSELGLTYRGHGQGLIEAGTVICSLKISLKKTIKPEASRALVDQILAYRGSKQPLELPNCGSVFKNPENSQKGAGRLIEAAGLKGLQVGQAQVSKKHANFVLNLGGATAFEIESLINQVSEKVFASSGVKLEREVIVVGDDKTS
jgi:UDP-N-acetylmuramate dehydrogenase